MGVLLHGPREGGVLVEGGAMAAAAADHAGSGGLRGSVAGLLFGFIQSVEDGAQEGDVLDGAVENLLFLQFLADGVHGEVGAEMTLQRNTPQFYYGKIEYIFFIAKLFNY